MREQNNEQNVMQKSFHILNAGLRVNGAVLQDGERSWSFPLFDQRQFNFCILKRNKVVFH